MEAEHLNMVIGLCGFNQVSQMQSLSRQEISDCVVKNISLICESDALIGRQQADVDKGIRQSDVIARSVARMPVYKDLNTIKIDVSQITAAQAAELISRL